VAVSERATEGRSVEDDDDETLAGIALDAETVPALPSGRRAARSQD